MSQGPLFQAIGFNPSLLTASRPSLPPPKSFSNRPGMSRLAATSWYRENRIVEINGEGKESGFDIEITLSYSLGRLVSILEERLTSSSSLAAI